MIFLTDAHMPPGANSPCDQTSGVSPRDRSGVTVMRLKRGRNWTDEEIEQLKRMAATELRVKAIAEVLHRTPEAVRFQARRSAVRLRETRLLEQCLLYGLTQNKAQSHRSRPAMDRSFAMLAAPASGIPDDLPTTR